MQLNNFYERALWTEWSKRMSLFASHTVRRQYYPHNMDSYHNLEKHMVSLRREQINNAKKMLGKLDEVEVRADYYQMWKTKCNPIKEHDGEPIYWSSSDKIEQFFDRLSVLENERLEFMYEKLAQLNAANALLLLHDETLKEEKHKVAIEKRKKTIDQRKKNVEENKVRRSARLDNKSPSWRRGSIYEKI